MNNLTKDNLPQTRPDNRGIRVHSALMRYKWARLWYFCRDRDRAGRGMVILSWQEIKTELRCADSTIYDWLRVGFCAGAFRYYHREGDRLTVYFGGLHKVCKKLGLKSWGTTATVLPDELWSNCRLFATTVTIQGLQQQSHYAARRCLKDKTYKVLTANEVVSEVTAPCPEPGWRATSVPYAIASEGGKLFVSKGYIYHGVTQETIAGELAISDRTVRDHLAKTGVVRVQQVKHCAAYSEIVMAMEWGAAQWTARDGTSIQRAGDHYLLFERNGWDSSSRKEGHRVTLKHFFKYKGKTWRLLPNLYFIRHDLTSAKYSRRRYKKLIAKKRTKPPQD